MFPFRSQAAPPSWLQAFQPPASSLPSAAWELSSSWQPFQKHIWEVHSPHISSPNAPLPSRLEPCKTYPTSLKPEEHQPPAQKVEQTGAGGAAPQPLQQPGKLVKSSKCFWVWSFRNQAPSNGTTWPSCMLPADSFQQSALSAQAM